MTPARSRAPLAVLLVALAVASGTAGVLLLAAAPEATGADAGQVPMAVAVPGGLAADGVPAPGGRHPGGSASSPPVGERSRTASGGRGVVHSPGERRVQPAAPRRLLIDAARLDAPVVPAGDRGDGQLALPEDPRAVSWWVGSAPAGDPRGATVLAGHVDSARAGLGALAVLRTLRVGTAIVLVDTFGTRHTYRMVARRSYPKTALPRGVLDPGKLPRLVLVTCGGPFDQARQTYRDNLVVYAAPA